MKKCEQIVELNNKIVELTAELETTKKKQKSSEDSSNSWYKSHNDIKKEIDQIHTLLDYLPNAVPKMNEDGYTEKSMLIRFSAWLAQRN